MYYVEKKIEVAFAHQLCLNYESKCTSLHGHNAIITVWCKAAELNENGMVIDFAEINRIVKTQLDHKCLNDILPFNPTAENIARWLCHQISGCYKVSVRESERNLAIYERDDI